MLRMSKNKNLTYITSLMYASKTLSYSLSMFAKNILNAKIDTVSGKGMSIGTDRAMGGMSS